MADLASEFLGIRSPNPFWLASAPPTDKAYNVNRAFEAGWDVLYLGPNLPAEEIAAAARSAAGTARWLSSPPSWCPLSRTRTSCPTTSSKRCGRYLRERTWCVTTVDDTPRDLPQVEEPSDLLLEHLGLRLAEGGSGNPERLLLAWPGRRQPVVPLLDQPESPFPDEEQREREADRGALRRPFLVAGQGGGHR